MLALCDLVYRYPNTAAAALNGVSFCAHSGRVLGLLGPNGAGKTTLISHLSGVLALQQGAITVDGQTLAQVRKEYPNSIALAPQEYAFYAALTVRENLRCFAAVAGLNGARTKERLSSCLNFSQLERFVDTRAERLSGGLKRRLNLAIALLAQPRILLLDEPTVGVDPQSRAFILNAVRTLAQQGTTVIYTSHYMDEIEAIADQIVILDHGKVLRDGSLADLLASTHAPMRLDVEGMSESQLRTALAAFGRVEFQDDQILLPDAKSESASAVLRAIEAAGGRVRRGEFGQYNLEQLFMSLTHRSLRDD